MGRVGAKIAVAVLTGWLVAACGATPGEPVSLEPLHPATSPARPSDDVEETPSPPPVGRRRRGGRPLADLDYLVERLKAIHPNPFLDEGEAGVPWSASRASARTSAR